MSENEVRRLGTYNAERGRGIVHTEDYDKEMVQLQGRFDRDQLEQAAAKIAPIDRRYETKAPTIIALVGLAIALIVLALVLWGMYASIV